MSELKCGVSTEFAAQIKDLTVGQVFAYRCQGAWPGYGEQETLDLSAWELTHDFKKPELQGALAGSGEAAVGSPPADQKPDPYILKVLQVQRLDGTAEDGVFELQVVGYRVGDHQMKAVQFLSKESSVVLGDLNFTVKSVQKPEEPIQEPFGAMGPLSFAVPWSMLGLLLAIVIATTAILLFPVFQRRKRKRWMAELPPLRQSQPEQELYRALRHDKKIEDINASFRLFLARKFQMPAHRLSSSQVLRELKLKQNSRAKLYEAQLKEILYELDRSLGTSQMSEADLESLRARARKVLDLMDRQNAQRGSL